MKRTLLKLLGIFALETLALGSLTSPVFSQEDFLDKQNKKSLLKKISKDRVFLKTDFKEYMQGYAKSEDGRNILAAYDLDNNGKTDMVASFPYLGEIKIEGATIYLTTKTASVIIFDKDGDTSFERAYMDLDLNGSLEYKPNRKNLRKFINKDIGDEEIDENKEIENGNIEENKEEKYPLYKL
jgi:hypothetical protein